MLPGPYIILSFVDLNISGYSQIVRTGIISFNIWGIAKAEQLKFVEDYKVIILFTSLKVPSGETFNASGKTNILIRADGRNIFIAECKFWRGPKVFNEAIDQLLSYLAWRDTKCALLIFKKTKDSSAILQKMHDAMEACPEYRRTASHDPDGDSRYILVKEPDPGREIIISTQIYDVPTPEK